MNLNELANKTALSELDNKLYPKIYSFIISCPISKWRQPVLCPTLAVGCCNFPS